MGPQFHPANNSLLIPEFSPLPIQLSLNSQPQEAPCRRNLILGIQYKLYFHHLLVSDMIDSVFPSLKIQTSISVVVTLKVLIQIDAVIAMYL